MSQPAADSHLRDWIEVTIPIPYGHLAAKWWGRRDVRPIVCLHGWQDNAGTFDTLIPLLPFEHCGYLAIDLPGHGFSSFQPHGLVYGHVQYMHILNYVFREHFRWQRVSLIGHSMSAILTFAFAATFPDYVDMAVSFDVLKPRVLKLGLVNAVLQSVNGNWLRTDLSNMNQVEPPTYGFDELLDRMVQATGGSIDRESAAILLVRGSAVSEKHEDQFYFRRDNRLKVINLMMMPLESLQRMAAQIRCPYLFFRSMPESGYSENRTDFQEVAQVMHAENPLFELCGVEGGHHVLLVEPEKVAAKVATFVRRWRGNEEAAVPSKL